MEQKRKCFIKRIKFYVKLGVLAVTPIVLTSCNEETNITPTPTTTIETVTPTEEPTVTPTEVVTPTPTEVVTPTPTPILPVSERKVSIDDIMLYENVIGDLYEEKQDFETEFNKKAQYYYSCGKISEKDANILVAFLNELHFVPENDELSQEIKDKYLLFITKENADRIPEICNSITTYNVEHPDDQKLFNYGAIGERAMKLTDRVKLAEIQKATYEISQGQYNHLDLIRNERKNYRYVLRSKDSTIMEELEFCMDDLNNISKYFSLAIPNKTAKVAAETKGSTAPLKVYNDNYYRFLENVENVLFNLERLHECTGGWGGEYYYNYKYDPDYLNQK